MSCHWDLRGVQEQDGQRKPGKALGVGIIGCGWIADAVHIPNLQARKDVAITAFADSSPERRHLASSRVPSARCYEHSEALLSDPEVQAVVIALPPAANRSVAVSAFAVGKHVYLEKPLAPNISDGEAIVSAWQRSSSIAMLGYNFRFNPGMENAISIIRSNALGELLTVQSRFTWAPKAVESWRGDSALGGGVLLDLASHHIDLFHAIVGTRLNCVHARTRSLVREADTIDVTMEDGRGTVFQLHASLAAGANTNRCSFLCEGGQLDVDLSDPRPRQALRGDGHSGRLARLRSSLAELHPRRIMAAPAEPSYARALDAFVRGCRSGVQPQPGLDQGLEVLRVVHAARQCAQASSSNQGRPQSAS